ncbi:Uncharacterised protein [Buttiauxella agrestis]|uniref:Uncharacterized protein n=1 Tax=Buttiauxella agrestis TaxID=82977 RepID=A0A381C5J0_9ENTR|nr:Uncharacterised protein [Buttiauxella agrestis]
MLRNKVAWLSPGNDLGYLAIAQPGLCLFDDLHLAMLLSREFSADDFCACT